MKIKFILATLFAFAFTISSCKKDSASTPATPTYPVQGLWTGTYTIDNDPSAPGSYFFSYAVYPDGSILVRTLGADGNPYYSIGNWTLSNANEFSATFITMNYNGAQVTQTITANFLDTGKMTNGIWTDLKNGNLTGKFSVNRIN